MTREETFQAHVKAAKSRGTWGQQDSVDFIMAMIENEVGEKPDEQFAGFIAEVVNPSAFRQKLEKAKILPQAVKGERRASGMASLIAALAD